MIREDGVSSKTVSSNLSVRSEMPGSGGQKALSALTLAIIAPHACRGAQFQRDETITSILYTQRQQTRIRLRGCCEKNGFAGRCWTSILERRSNASHPAQRRLRRSRRSAKIQVAMQVDSAGQRLALGSGAGLQLRAGQPRASPTPCSPACRPSPVQSALCPGGQQTDTAYCGWRIEIGSRSSS